jgi:hypothetical protein
MTKYGELTDDQARDWWYEQVGRAYYELEKEVMNLSNEFSERLHGGDFA